MNNGPASGRLLSLREHSPDVLPALLDGLLAVLLTAVHSQVRRLGDTGCPVQTEYEPSHQDGRVRVSSLPR
ncbi:hypothetical protein L209DRAFT_752816 [Thermothelomyces heterothallicus CBS 203.75]